MTTTLPVVADDTTNFVSPSQVQTYRRCVRRWGWQYITKIKPPQGEAAALGDDTHKELEDYMVSKGLKLPSNDKPGQLANSALEHLPIPSIAKVRAEGKFEVMMDGVTWIGRIDLVDETDVLNITIHDYKTTSDMKWALSEEELRRDPQGILYALWGHSKYGVTKVNLQWTYMLKKKPYKARPVRTTLDLTSAEFHTNLAAIHSIALEMREYRRTKPDPLTMPHNLDACGDYNGCPHQERCGLTPERTLANIMTQRNLIEELQKGLAGNPNALPPALPQFAAPQQMAPVPTVFNAPQQFAPPNAPQLPGHFAAAANVPALPQVAPQGVPQLPPGFAIPTLPAAPQAPQFATPVQLPQPVQMPQAQPVALPPGFAGINPPETQAQPIALPQGITPQMLPAAFTAPVAAPQPAQALPVTTQATVGVAVTEPPKAKRERKAKETTVDGFLLLVDVLPMKGGVVPQLLAEVLAPLQATVAAKYGVRDYRQVDYAKGDADLSVALADMLAATPLTGAVYASSDSRDFKAVSSVLLQHAAQALQGV